MIRMKILQNGIVDEEVANADLFSLLKTYMNDKLKGIEKTFSDTTYSLAKKVRKTENSFKFKGNQLQFELNTDIRKIFIPP